jgi:hypothetical protein
MEWYHTGDLICLSLMTNGIEQFSKCLRAICVFSLEKFLFEFLSTFFFETRPCYVVQPILELFITKTDFELTILLASAS